MKRKGYKALLFSFILCLFLNVIAYADTGTDSDEESFIIFGSRTKIINTLLDKNAGLIDKLKYKQAADISESYKYSNRVSEVIKNDIIKHTDASESADTTGTAIFKISLTLDKKTIKNKGYNYEAVSVKGTKLYLFGVNESKDLVDLIGTFDNASINDTKIEIYYINNYIKVWSQAPYNALERTILLKWDGKKLIKAASIDNDPSQQFLDNQLKLIKSGNFKEALASAKKNGGILYPESYESYKTLGKEAIIISESIAKKQKKNIAQGISKLEDATDYYCGIYDLNEYKLDIRNVTSFSKNNLIKIQQLVPDKSKLQYTDWSSLIYLYGDLLNKQGDSRKSLSYFLKAIELNEGNKQAYLSAGDISWSLKKYDDAKKYYKKYIDLSKNDMKVIPPRVTQRSK